MVNGFESDGDFVPSPPSTIYHQPWILSQMIRLIGVEKKLGGQPVLQGIDLSIPVGKLTTIIGRSGEGKSVLLKHMIGLMQPDRGEVWVGDVEVSRLSGMRLNDVRKRFAMLFQGAALLDSLSVFENVAF